MIGWYLLFIVLILGVVGYGTLRRNAIIAWRLRYLLKKERRDYLDSKMDEVQRTLCSKQMTVYIDDALDEVHEKARLEYQEAGIYYHWYPEKSNEVIWLEGHPRSFDLLFALEIAYHFSLTRYKLLRGFLTLVESNWVQQDVKEDCPLNSDRFTARRLIFSKLLCAVFPVLDTVTRVKQRIELDTQ